MTRFQIYLNDDDFGLLRELAKQEYREITKQAGLLIHEALINRHILKKEELINIDELINYSIDKNELFGRSKFAIGQLRNALIRGNPRKESDPNYRLDDLIEIAHEKQNIRLIGRKQANLLTHFLENKNLLNMNIDSLTQP